MIPSLWYVTVLAAFFLVTPFLFYGFVSIKLLQIRPASFIFTELKLLLRYGGLYNTFTDDTFAFFLSIIVYKSVVAAMIGLFQTSGLAQIILVIIAECSLMAGLLYKLPYADSQVNYVHIMFGFIRITVLVLNIAYVPNLHASTMSKQYVGYVQLAIHCLAFFLYLMLQIKNLVTIITGLGDDELDETGKPPARMVMWRKRNRPPTHQMRANSTATLMTAASSGGARGSRSYSASFYMANNGSGSNRNSNNRLTMDSQTLDMFTNYYGAANSSTATHNNVAVLKPDEVRSNNRNYTTTATTSESTPNNTNANTLSQYPALVSDYLNNNDPTIEIAKKPTVIPPSTNDQITEIPAESNGSAARNVYRLDDDIIPSTEPLMSSINNSLSQRQQSTTTTTTKANISQPPPPLPKHLIFDNDPSSPSSPPHQPSPPGFT